MKHINSLPLFIFLGLAIIGCSEPKPVQKTDDAIPVKLISSNALTENEPVETSGLLSSEQQSNLSFKTGGIINRIFVKEGDHVNNGQVLASLNMTEVNAQLNQAEEGFNKAKRDAQRTANLFKDSVSTREQLENTQTALVIAKKSLDIARFNATQSTIRANTSGVVLKKLANEGEQVAGGTPILYISSVSTKDWIVKCGITDKDRSRISGNEKVDLNFDVFPQTITGVVKSLAQGTDAASGLYQAEIRLNPTYARLISGLFAKVKIYPFGKTDLLSVPVDALVEGKNDSAYVYTSVNNRAVKKAVKVAYLKNDKAFISAGIVPTDQIIREGSAYLTNGAPIKIIR
ncbi:efflux RND transporter periplasmic adaptor subunit [Pedobacter ginsengisoli]|uniref:efflux RND transporter periplasmic adaptor subunit n=1 Tax=Pedobacter ginsengisoli TaxID=363852 RepID=UPI0015620947|nr:efflux RND transporter periplasmic adaptor subunit [Pedobacter ginsengisoli]